MKTAPTNTDDVIDSRDIIERIEELESERADLSEEIETHTSETAEAAITALQIWDHSAEADELMILKVLAEEGEGSPDWEHGETLIRDSYFRDYAQELAEDCCEMPKSDQWPQRCIDWEQAADELKMDYTSIDFDGVDYWIRA